MKAPTVKLKKNLRKNILRGNPWLYQDAVSVDSPTENATLCKVKDKKGDFLAWGFYDPHGAISVRILSFDKKPPNEQFFASSIRRAMELRSSIDRNSTNCFRLINGEGDGMPGLICDIYGSVAVLQFDGTGPFEFWPREFIANWTLENTDLKTVYFKPRHDSSREPEVWGEGLLENTVQVQECGATFEVDIVNGQKTGFFLDQRENRSYVSSFVRGRTVMNLFSYSGGFSVAAGRGGATRVVSVDIAQGALELAQSNWSLNSLPEEDHEIRCKDVFDYVQECEEKFDVVICDPPSLAKSEKTKERAIEKYIETFAGSAKCLTKGGHLVLSSCSSHISFLDFEEIVNQAMSRARFRAQVVRVSGQGPDHPFPHACPHLRYLKFMHLVIQD